jgi:hypothetical protein
MLFALASDFFGVDEEKTQSVNVIGFVENRQRASWPGYGGAHGAAGPPGAAARYSLNLVRATQLSDISGASIMDLPEFRTPPENRSKAILVSIRNGTT